MSITRIHVNSHTLRANAKSGRRDPVLSVKAGGTSRPASSVEITGPCRVVYSPDKPLSCGAVVWVETEGVVVVDGE